MSPELLDYKPVYARTDMNIMLKLLEQELRGSTSAGYANKVEDSVRKHLHT